MLTQEFSTMEQKMQRLEVLETEIKHKKKEIKDLDIRHNKIVKEHEGVKNENMKLLEEKHNNKIKSEQS
jgi:hypothetical protein